MADTPTYRDPAMMEAFKRDLIHVVEEWEKRQETMLADPEAKARFFTFRAFELTNAAILDDTPAPAPVTKEIVEAFYRAHDSSLENQPREYHQAIFDGIAAALKAATSSAAYPSPAPRVSP